MTNKELFNSGLFFLKEAVFNVLSEEERRGTPELSNREISEILGVGGSHFDNAGYALIRGILDILRQENRVEKVEGSKKMIWKVVEGIE